MRFRRLRFFILLVALLFSMLLGIWLARVQITEWGGLAALRQAGAEDIKFEVSSTEIDRTALKHVSFKFATEAGTLTLEGSGVSALYSTESLKVGRLTHLDIDDLVLGWESNGTATATQNQPQPAQILEALTTVKRQLDPYLILDQLQITRLTLRGAGLGPLDGKSLKLMVSQGDQALEARAALVADEGSQSSLRLLLKDQALDLNLGFSDHPEAQSANMHVALEGQQLAAKYEIQPKGLQQWLEPFIKLDFRMKGESIGGSIDLQPVEPGRLQAQISAASNRLWFGSLSITKPKFKLIFEVPAQQPVTSIQLAKGSNLGAELISQDMNSLKGLAADLSGEWLQRAEGWDFQGQVKLDPLTPRAFAQQVPLAGLDAQVLLQGQALRLNGNIQHTRFPERFEYELSQDLASGQGQLKFGTSSPLQFDAEKHRLSQLTSHWLYPVDLIAGGLGIQAKATWSKKLGLSLGADVSLNEAGGTLAGKLAFAGLTTEQSLELLPAQRSQGEGLVQIAHVDAGIVSEAISCKIRIEQSDAGPLPMLAVRDLKGGILGGSYHSDEIRYDLNQETHAFVVEVEDLDLATIVATQGMNDVQATGKVKGKIPVEINAEGVVVQGGELTQSADGGIIQYRPSDEEAMRQNVLTGIALDALKDFRYSQLTAGVDYAPDGNLGIHLELQGKSPGLDDTRPVHLNINLEQNLLQLLKSLGFAEGVSEIIDGKVRRQTQGSNKAE